MIQSTTGKATSTISIEFGRRMFWDGESAKLAVGQVVELASFADDYVDVYADGRLIARGLPIVVDGRLGIRVQESFIGAGRSHSEAKV